MENDLVLLDRWRGGDLTAGNQLFERHFDAVFRFFSHKVQGDVGDLVQRTFVACVEAKERFREECSFRTFVFSVARHELYRHWRMNKQNADLDVGASSLLDLGPSPSAVVLKRSEERVLLVALRGISLDLQLAIELYYWEGLRGPDLALVLGVPEGTARSKLRRGLEALRVRLNELSAPQLGSTVDNLDAWAESLGQLRAALAVDGR